MDAEPVEEWPRPPLWFRVRHLPEWALGFVMFSTTTVGLLTYLVDFRHGLPPMAFVALSAGAVACLSAWRWQLPTLALAVASTLIAGLAGVNPILEWNLALFATVALMMRGMSIWWSLLPAIASYDATVIFYAGLGAGWSALMRQEAVAAGLATVAFAAIGRSVLTSRRYWEQVSLRARELALAQDVAVARGVAEERLRIARDLHDVIGHEIAVTNMSLGAAEVHLAQGADAAPDLAAARESIQSVLAETQKILRILRTSEEPATLAEPESLSDYQGIPALIEHSRRAGVDVDVVMPDAPALTAEVSRASYRVVQESLTNASKYCTGSVALQIRQAPPWLEIEVVNRQRPGRARRLGYGLVGMRERVTSVGGELVTSDDDGLFWVRVRLPLVLAREETN